LLKGWRHSLEVIVKRSSPIGMFALLMLLYAVHPAAGFVALLGAFAYAFRRHARRAEASR
jgi:hypothetical protein